MVNPYMICSDGSGNLYIADYWTITVRKIDAINGIVNVYAGQTSSAGVIGDGGLATAAKLASPSWVCIDRTRKQLYISDAYSYKIRKVDMTTNIISTFAGTGVNGFSGDGMAATSAQLSRTLGICIDQTGNLFISDWDNARIRKVDIVTGIITTIVGNGILGYSGDNGLATNSKINKATGICMDKCGNLFLADEFNHCVRRIDAQSNVITTIAGNGVAGFSGDNGIATAAQFNDPDGICIDEDGAIYVSDYYNHRIRKITFDTLCDGTQLNANNVQRNNAISIYPNPANDVLHIDEAKKGQEYKVYSIIGAVLLQGVLKEGSNTVGIGALPAGMYVVEVGSAGLTMTKSVMRIIKQ